MQIVRLGDVEETKKELFAFEFGFLVVMKLKQLPEQGTQQTEFIETLFELTTIIDHLNGRSTDRRTIVRVRTETGVRVVRRRKRQTRSIDRAVIRNVRVAVVRDERRIVQLIAVLQTRADELQKSTSTDFIFALTKRNGEMTTFDDFLYLRK